MVNHAHPAILGGLRPKRYADEPRLAVALRVVSAIAWLATLAVPGNAAHTKVSDLVYGSYLDDEQASHSLLLDLYLPTDAPAPFPVVLWIHGGAWLTGSKEPTPAEFLADAGFAVASINYRLSTEAKWPAQIHDCKGAVRWLRAHATEHGLDPNRVGVWGPSSGGHLAACVGTLGGVGEVRIGSLSIDLEGDVGGNLDQSSRVAVVVDWFGPTDFLRMSQYPSEKAHDAANSWESQLIGAPIQESPELCRSANPMTFLSRDDPPAWVVHGTADPLVPYPQSLALARRAVDGFGLDYTLRVIPNGAHGGAGFEDAEAQAFLEQRLKSLPDVTVSVTASGGELREEQPRTSSFTVSRSGPTVGDLSVRVAFGGDAWPGIDYAAIPSSFVIPDGATSISIVPAALDDALVEGTEVLELVLCQSLDYRVDASQDAAQLSILDDDDPAGLPVVGVSALVGVAEEGGPSGSLRVRRTGGDGSPLDVAYAVGGDVTNGVDLPWLDGVFSFATGESVIDVPVDALQDGAVEAAELLIISLRSGVDYQIDPEDRATSVRFDDTDRDPSLPLVNVVATDREIGEGAVASSFLITRVGPVGAPMTAAIAAQGTATPGVDYPPFTPGIALDAGQESILLFGVTNDDSELEGRETLALALLPDPSYQIGVSARDEVAIADDEAMSVPSTLRIDCSEVILGRPFSLTLDGMAPGSTFVLFIGTADAFLPVAGSSPLLLDLATAFPVLGGVTTATPFVTAFEAPVVPDATGLRIVAQAIAFGPTPSLSNLVRRMILAE